MSTKDPSRTMQVRVLAPRFTEEDQEWLQKNERFILTADLEESAIYLGQCPLPSIGDILGVPMGPALPCFAFLTGQKELTLPCLLMFVAPGTPIADHLFEGEYQFLEPCVLGGAVFLPLLLTGAGLEVELEALRRQGYHIVSMVDYEVPTAMLNHLASLRRPR